MNDIKRRLLDSISRNDAAFIGFLSFVVFMFGIWKQPFINFETRFAVFAQEMLRNGPTLFPTTYGQPYPDYPVTSTLMIWLLSLPFGEVTKFAAVLPTAFASAIVVALTYKLFAQYSWQWGVLAICFEFLTLIFDAEARSISVDQMISAVTIAAFYLTHKSYRDNTPLPTNSLLLLLVAGFLIRGPIGICLPAGVVLSHLVLTHGRREAITYAITSSGVLIACSITLIGLALLIYGKNFVADVAQMQALSRFSESRQTSIFYYLTSSFGNYALSYPIALLVALSVLLLKARKRAQDLDKEHLVVIVLLLAWVGIVLIGLSIPETKKPRYILPIVPPLAGLASYVFIGTELRLMKWLRRGVEWLLMALPLLAIILVYTQRTKIAEAGIGLAFAFSVLFFLFFGGMIIHIASKYNHIKRAILLCVFGSMTACFFQIYIVEKIDLHLHDTSAFVRRIESLREGQPGNLVFYKENPDGLPIKYLVNAKLEFSPQFIQSPDKLGNENVPLWLLTRDENVAELQAAGIDTESDIYHENFAGTPFSAIYIGGHSARTTSSRRSAQ